MFSSLNMKYFILKLILFFPLLLWSQMEDPLASVDIIEQTKWVDSVYKQLSLNEKIAQLHMVQVFSNQDDYTTKKLTTLIKNHKIGGILYSKGGPVRQAKLNNKLQSMSKVPMLVAMDAEWGLNMRLDSTFAFPWNMTLGAVKDLNLIQKTGKYIGEHCKRLGVHVNFAPVVDINTNPLNPIIGNRSFGEDKFNVTEKSLAFMQGLQSAGVLANAKHFPGHGDTDRDSHKTLPTINFDSSRIDSIELYPFKKLINAGLASVMVAHLNVPALESEPGLPSSLSKSIVTGILKKRLGFKGLIFTDDITMNGATNSKKQRQVDLAAFLAGNDIILMSADVPKSIAVFKKAYQDGKLTESRLSHSVKKILRAKYKLGLNQYTPVDTTNLISDLQRSKDKLLHSQLVESSLTVIQNLDKSIPIKELDATKFAYVPIGTANGLTFYNTLNKYSKVDLIRPTKNTPILELLLPYDTVIVGYHMSNKSPWSPYKFSKLDLEWLSKIAKHKKVILTVFAKPYALSQLTNVKDFSTIVVAYQNSSLAQSKSAQLIFGALPASGKLPVSAEPHFPKGSGIIVPSIQRLGYTLPEAVGVNATKLAAIDSIVDYAIASKIIPGAQIIIARNGKVFFQKSYGFHTYKKETKVTSTHLYDLASLTKILVTTPLVMQLVDRGLLDLDTSLDSFLPEYKNHPKGKLTLANILSHRAMLTPWIPFYKNTIDHTDLKPLPKYFQPQQSDIFSVQVASEFYMRSDYKDTIYQLVKDSPFLSGKKSKYSDLPFYMLQPYLESTMGKPLDQLIQHNFFLPIGANYTTFNPLQKTNISNIVPTEEDDYFRHQRLQGYVHDMGAAMLGGVAGHAGLFANANDVAKMMQLFLQNGTYGGKRYFSSDTMERFNNCIDCNEEYHHGIGFNKPQFKGDGPTCGCVSMDSFGHSGYTGTYTWADPEKEIVYVFLTNRTYPKDGVNRLSKENIRTEIQRIIYKSIIDSI